MREAPDVPLRAGRVTGAQVVALAFAALALGLATIVASHAPTPLGAGGVAPVTGHTVITDLGHAPAPAADHVVCDQCAGDHDGVAMACIVLLAALVALATARPRRAGWRIPRGRVAGAVAAVTPRSPRAPDLVALGISRT